MSWLSLSLLAFLGFGLQNFLYKIAAEAGQNSRIVTFYFIVFSTIVLWVALFVSGTGLSLSIPLLGLAVIDALAFYATTVTRLEALRYIPTHLAFPILRVSTLIVALCGLIFFDEPFTWNIGAGIGLLLFAAWLISLERKHDQGNSPQYLKGIALCAIAMIFSATTNVVSKLAADLTQILDYMTLANTLIIVLSLSEIRISTGARIAKPKRAEVVVALGLAASNLLAWYCYLLALQKGPLNATAVITGMGFVVPIVLAAILFKERLTWRRILAVTCTALTVVLLKSS